MRTALITIHTERCAAAFPLAAAIIKTALLNDPDFSTSEVTILDYYPDDSAEDIYRALEDLQPDAAGFSVYTWNAEKVLQTASLLKKRLPGSVVFAGGPQVTADPERFGAAGFFDFIVQGDAEPVIAGLLSSSLYGRKPSDAAAADFISLPSPYQAVSYDSGGYSGVLWELSRGCPYSCSFCYESGGNRTSGTISDERITKELKLFKGLGIEKIWVLDPTFNRSREHAENVLKKIIKYYPYAHYTFEIRAELLTEDMCRLFSRLDVSLQIGLQSSNRTVLKNIGRSLEPKRFLSRCRMLSSYGIRFGIDLIYGLPGDSLESFIRSAEFALKAEPNNLDIFRLSVLPGTRLSEDAEKFGIRHSGFPDYLETENTTFSRSEMDKAEMFTESIDVLYNREKAFTWLQPMLRLLQISAADLISRFNPSDSIENFIRKTFAEERKKDFIPLFESLLRWNRAAEEAAVNPGRLVSVELCMPPEQLEYQTAAAGTEQQAAPVAFKNSLYNVVFRNGEFHINRVSGSK